MLHFLTVLAQLSNPFPNVPADDSSVQKILELALGVIASVTVIFIIINAIRYSTSLGGDPKANEKIRNSIIYAAIGLAVVLGAEVIVMFVLGRLQ